MTALLVALALAVLLALVAVGAAGLCYGLWRGEQGRRAAAENMRVYGSPERFRATVTDRDADNPEQRAMDAGRLISQETIERGAREIQEEYKRRGMDIPLADARRQAETMLTVGEFMPLDPPTLTEAPL